MKPLVYCVATRCWKGWLDCVGTWFETASTEYSVHIACNMDVVPALQECYENTTEPILAYIQDDVQIFEKGWDRRVLSEFDDPRVGLVGFGGAVGHGHPRLYCVPYYLPDLARQDFYSNMRSWKQHGKQFTGERDVAVIDGFAGFVRRTVLQNWHRKHQTPGGGNEITAGFPQREPIGYYMVWENLCCEVRRQGFRIRLVGVECEHLGGRTSTVHQVNSDYEAEHKYFYEHNRDVMPYRVTE